MPKRDIPPGLIDYTLTFLGKDGLKFFQEMKEEHGRVDAVFMDGRFPHAVHFQEGMQVRNAMRDSGLCTEWDDHDFDDSWVSLMEACLEKHNNGRVS